MALTARAASWRRSRKLPRISSVAAILDTYNSAMVQPNPLFSGEMNYLANKMLSLGVTDIKKPFPEETVMLDGEDITAQVKEAWDFLVEHAFVM